MGVSNCLNGERYCELESLAIKVVQREGSAVPENVKGFRAETFCKRAISLRIPAGAFHTEFLRHELMNYQITL